MATIGNLLINIKARTKDMADGLSKARRQLRKFAGRVKATAQSMKKIGSAFAKVGVVATAAAAGIFWMIKRAAESIDATAKMAARAAAAAGGGGKKKGGMLGGLF